MSLNWRRRSTASSRRRSPTRSSTPSARRVWIEVREADGSVAIVVGDDGRGFDPEGAAHGLRAGRHAGAHDARSGHPGGALRAPTRGRPSRSRSQSGRPWPLRRRTAERRHRAAAAADPRRRDPRARSGARRAPSRQSRPSDGPRARGRPATLMAAGHRAGRPPSGLVEDEEVGVPARGRAARPRWPASPAATTSMPGSASTSIRRANRPDGEEWAMTTSVRSLARLVCAGPPAEPRRTARRQNIRDPPRCGRRELRSGRVEQPAVQRVADEVGSRGAAQLLLDVRPVGLHGPHREVELLGRCRCWCGRARSGAGSRPRGRSGVGGRGRRRRGRDRAPRRGCRYISPAAAQRTASTSSLSAASFNT